MKTTLTKAFQEFLDDLTNVIPQLDLSEEKTHEEIVDIIRQEIKDKKTNDIKFLNIGKIYIDSNAKTKKAILSHLNHLKALSEKPKEEIEDLPESGEKALACSDELAMLLPQVLNQSNLQKMADVVSRHQGKGENVVEILKNVVNSEEFEDLAKDLTKSLKRNK